MLSHSDVSIPRSYPTIALSTFFVLSTCIWVFCFFLDPYRLYPEIPGFGREKSADLFYHLRLHKPYAIERIQPDTLITGSSRAAGLPPQPLNTSKGVAYNAALPNATLREIRQIVEHAHAIRPQQLLLVSLDRPMFRLGHSEQMVLDEPHRYRKVDANLRDRLQHAYQRLIDIWRSLYSVDAMFDAWQVLYGNRRGASDYHQDGTWELAGRNGLSPNWLYSSLIHQVYNQEKSSNGTGIAFDELEDILDFADANGIQVILLVAPMQGLLMETVNLAGTWEEYLDWQRDLVSLVEARNSDTKIFGVEDKPQLVLERIDSPHPQFVDGIHYTRAAGYEIVRCLVDVCDSNVEPTLLTSSSINAYLERVDALRSRYVYDYPTDVARMRKWLRVDASND